MKELRWIASRAAGRRPEMLWALEETLRLADVGAAAESIEPRPLLPPRRQWRPPAAG